MLELSDELYRKLCKKKVRAFFKDYPNNGVECFASINEKDLDSDYFVKTVYAGDIMCYEDGSYHLDYSDIKKDVLPIIGAFTPCRKHKKQKSVSKQRCASQVDDNVGKKIDGQGCLVDVSQLPAFNTDTTNEDVAVNEYKFFLTLFNEYTISQCIYERNKLYDAKVTSSKYDLPAKLQNSDFLKSKDFTVINVRRNEMETVPVGLIVKESADKYVIEYGTVFIDMNNIVSIKWN